MYYLFEGYNYEAAGGVYDFVEDFATIEEALERAASCSGDWWHIADSQMKIVKKGP